MELFKLIRYNEYRVLIWYGSSTCTLIRKYVKVRAFTKSQAERKVKKEYGSKAPYFTIKDVRLVQ